MKNRHISNNLGIILEILDYSELLQGNTLVLFLDLSVNVKPELDRNTHKKTQFQEENFGAYFLIGTLIEPGEMYHFTATIGCLFKKQQHNTSSQLAKPGGHHNTE